MLTETALTIGETLESSARTYADHIALLAPDRAPLTYRVLYDHTNQIAARLNRAGIGRGDRVAIVLSGGAEFATAMLSVACVATAACLKSTLRAEEYTDLFTRIGVKSVILEYGTPSVARDAAFAQGLPIMELQPCRDKAAGVFDLVVSESTTPALSDAVWPDDPAWMVLTSGTTGRPKILAITHKMAWYRSKPGVEVRQLSETDRLLLLAPVSSGGTTSKLLSMLVTGGSVVMPPNFDIAQFFDYLDTFQPTWCNATATAYQSILANAAFRNRSLAGTSLRFLRAGSMALPPQLMYEMENAFQIPVLQGYGSRETGSIADSPLPPHANKPGSVGLTRHEVRIVDGAGSSLPTGTAGEIVVRGPTVMSGYENDPEANQKAFFGDWFRTGDLGYLDEDGYLFITGRIKDMINRGAEMISPTEVENILLTHPAVAQAAVFAILDHRLGEDLAAAVVLRGSQSTTERALRTFAAEHLAATKVPRRIIFVEDIPKSDVGKIQRVGLAEKFGLNVESASEPPEPEARQDHMDEGSPRTPLEAQIAAIWMEVLSQPRIGIYDEFLDMGGDSLTATRLISRLRRNLQIEITLLDFFDAPTIAQQAIIIENLLNL